MDDLIRRQDAIKAVGFYSCHSGDKLLFADNALKNIPSVDAVEVVRCKDCKHFYLAPCGKGSCQRSKWSVFAIGLNGFCSYGEKGKPMDDLISRQAALEATSAKIKITGKENAETVYKYIKKLCDDIKALPSAQQWIPCSERLPEEDGLEVLFSSRFGRVHIGKYHDDASLNRWFSYRDKIRLMNDEVTAWMPLQEPYREETES